MQVLIAFSVLISLASCGLISHDDGHKATSYQNVHIEHFHSVPTYIKKEDHHLLEHPLPKGKSTSNLEVHHGGKHEHGFAIIGGSSDLHGHHGEHETIAVGGGHHGHHAEIASGSQEGLGLGEGHEAASYGFSHEALQGQEHGHDFSQYAQLAESQEGQQQAAQVQPASLGHAEYAAALEHYQSQGGNSQLEGGQQGYGGGESAGLGHYGHS